MPLAYRSVLSAESNSKNLATVKEVVDEWLILKRLTPPTTNGSVTVNGKVISHFQTAKNDWAAERWQVEEHWPEPTWYSGEKDDSRKGITSITSVSKNGVLFLWVEVESPLLRYKSLDSENLIEESQEAGTPKVVKSLMTRLQLSDGELPVVDDVLNIRENNLRPLLKHLSDPSRTTTLFLGVQPRNTSTTEWEAKLKNLTRGSDGLAAIAYIEADLAQKFTKLIGFGHSVPPGGIRTFLPGVKPFDSEDTYRHKLLTPGRIQAAKNPEKLARMLRRSLIARLEHTKLPAILLEIDSELLRVARFLPFANAAGLRDSASPTNPGSVEVADVEDEKSSEEITFWKAIAAAYEADANEQKAIANDLKVWQGLANELDARVASQAAEISQLESHVELLRGKLSAQNRVDEAFEEFVPPAEAQIPDSFEELVGRISEFENLVYVGNPNDPLALDEHTGIASAITNAWNTLRTLSSYAELKNCGDFTRGFMNYTRGESKKGFRKMPLFKPAESETVNNNPRFRKQREMPVPTEIDPAGVVVAQMHVDLQNVNNYPRMYFYDATGTNGRIYIGYIGEHLNNTRTN